MFFGLILILIVFLTFITQFTVNTWHELDSTTKEFQKRISPDHDSDEVKRTSTAICDHCYRSFANLAQAQEHEMRCDRNPNGIADVSMFHLSSVYRDLRPPPPLMIEDCGDIEIEI